MTCRSRSFDLGPFHRAGRPVARSRSSRRRRQVANPDQVVNRRRKGDATSQHARRRLHAVVRPNVDIHCVSAATHNHRARGSPRLLCVKQIPTPPTVETRMPRSRGSALMNSHSAVNLVNTNIIFPGFPDCCVEPSEQFFERFSLVTNQGGELLIFVAGDCGTVEWPDSAQSYVTMAIDQGFDILQLHGHLSSDCSVNSTRPNAPAQPRRANPPSSL